ncbi:MAG: hypothetical protein AVDCRST_MAG79-2531, partial [uncultured Thermoleophilia bacterium]
MEPVTTGEGAAGTGAFEGWLRLPDGTP